MKISTLEFIHKMLQAENIRADKAYKDAIRERGGSLEQIAKREEDADRCYKEKRDAESALLDFEKQEW